MFKLSGKGQRKPFCINEECPNFLPEDKRGYKRRRTAEGEAGGEKTEESAGSETPEVKAEAPEEKPAKTAAKKTAAKKPAAKKTAAKKTADGKAAAAKKTTAKKAPAKKKTAE